MNSRQRMLAAMNHQESDHVPFDLGGTVATGIHKTAYHNLRRYLKMPEVEIRTEDIIQQLATVDEDLAEYLGADCRNVAPRSSAIYNLELRDEGDYTAYTDEWGIDWRMPKVGGFYYDMVAHPLSAVESVEQTASYTWPNPVDPSRFTGLHQRAKAAHEEGRDPGRVVRRRDRDALLAAQLSQLLHRLPSQPVDGGIPDGQGGRAEDRLLGGRLAGSRRIRGCGHRGG
jgi:uroporphyrinogen decarboxylase